MFEALATYMGMGWIYYVLVVIYALTVVAIVIVIISENRNPVKSLAWVTVLLLLPFVYYPSPPPKLQTTCLKTRMLTFLIVKIFLGL